MSAKSTKAAGGKLPTKRLSMAEKINNHMPAGLTVEQSGEGRVKIAVDSTVRPDRFVSVGGCKSEFANLMMLNQVLEAMPQTSDLATAAVRAAGAVHMMEAFAPKDGVPHEILLAIARGEAVDGHVPSLHERMTAARIAAPFYAPRLASVTHEAVGGGQVVVERIEIVIVNPEEPGGARL